MDNRSFEPDNKFHSRQFVPPDISIHPRLKKANDNSDNVSTSSSEDSCHLQVNEGITFAWSNICVSTREQKVGKCCGLLGSETKPAKQLLKNVSGMVKPGELLAIMGASGAGKSTLLNTLLFRNMGDLKITGTRMANRSLVTPNSLTALSGYVQQDDLFFGTLTVIEHLTFQAMVRMDKEIPMSKRMERVEEVLKGLGLAKSRDTVIGIPGRIKGISGGEMKRLAVASEVLTNPPLLFCDEPTSGLDSFMSASVMELMREMAKQGRTVICTIHQPSSQIFAKFDRLLLMAEGQVAYLGDAKLAKNIFDRCHLPCPEDYNPSDHYVECLAIQPGLEEESKARVSTVVKSYNESQEGRALLKEVVEMETSLNKDEMSVAEKRSPYKASWWVQFYSLIWRNWLALIKEPQLVQVRVGSSIVIAFILGIIYLQQNLDQNGVMNINGAIFILITNLSFSNIFAVVTVFCAELPIFLREHFNGMYRVDTYFLTKQIVELPVSLCGTAVFVVIFYFMVGLDITAEKFFLHLIVVLLVVQVVMSLGYFLSCISPNVEIGLALAPVILIPFLLFGGFFLNTVDVPIWLIWLKYLSWFLYGFEALLINQWDGIENITCPAEALREGVPSTFLLDINNSTEEDLFTGLEQNVADNFTTAVGSMMANFSASGGEFGNYAAPGGDFGNYNSGGGSPAVPCLHTGGQVLTQLNFYKENFNRDIGVLIALSVGLRIAAYIALLLRTRRKS